MPLSSIARTIRRFFGGFLSTCACQGSTEFDSTTDALEALLALREDCPVLRDVLVPDEFVPVIEAAKNAPDDALHGSMVLQKRTPLTSTRQSPPYHLPAPLPSRSMGCLVSPWLEPSVTAQLLGLSTLIVVIVFSSRTS